MACALSLGTPWYASHRCAARLWRLDGEEGVIEFSGPIRSSIGRRDVLLHLSSSVHRLDVSTLGYFPISSPTRTLVDLGDVCDRGPVEDALESALRKRLTTIDKLRAAIDRVGTRGRRGAALLAELLRERGDIRPTESVFETRLSRYLCRHGLPIPQRQVEIYDESGFVTRVDFAYPNERLILEADGFDHHGGYSQWSNDARKRNPVIAQGWRIIQVTWSDLGDGHLASLIRRALRCEGTLFDDSVR